MGLFRTQNPSIYRSEEDIELYGDDDVVYPSKLSDKWRMNFFKRHGFSFRKLGTKMNKKAIQQSHTDQIRAYHIDTRIFQLSQRNDSIYGFTSPHYVYSHDQVPIELASKTEMTIDDTGVSVLLSYHTHP